MEGKLKIEFYIDGELCTNHKRFEVRYNSERYMTFFIWHEGELGLRRYDLVDIRSRLKIEGENLNQITEFHLETVRTERICD